MSLDPGIVRTVGLLHSWGFQTTDSGDGASKFLEGAPPMECALDFPHVVIRVEPASLVEESRRLRSLLEKWGVVIYEEGPKGSEGVTVSEEGSGSGGPWISASYDPVSDVAIIFLGGLGDDLLP